MVKNMDPVGVKIENYPPFKGPYIVVRVHGQNVHCLLLDGDPKIAVMFQGCNP